MLCDFLTRWLTLAHARRVKAATLESFFHAHNCRRAHLMNARIENMRISRSFTEDPAVIPPAQMIVETLVAQLRILIEAIERFDTEIGHTELWPLST
jgi:hypothetical protein